MDYNKFEDRISDWIENSLDVKERKEFEKFLQDNPQYHSKVNSVIDAMNTMKNAPFLKVSDNFDDNLKQKIKLIDHKSKVQNNFFGFSKQNFIYLTLSVFFILTISVYLLQPSDSNYFVSEDDSRFEQNDKQENNIDDIKDIDIINDVNSSFVTDKY